MLVAGVNQQDNSVPGIDSRADRMSYAVALVPQRLHSLHQRPELGEHGVIYDEGLGELADKVVAGSEVRKGVPLSCGRATDRHATRAVGKTLA